MSEITPSPRTTLRRIVALAALLALLAIDAAALSPARAAELRLLSAGAVEPGLRPVVASFERATGQRVALTFATAPQLRERAGTSLPFDVVIAPPAVLDELAATGRIDGAGAMRVTIGTVGIGVAVRPDAPRPDVSTPEALAQALRDADSIVYNRASTGLYIEGLLKRQQLDLDARTTRYPDGASVMEHVLQGRGREIGFGATTEILLLRERGLVFVGPLPAAWQNATRYQASAAAAPADARAARALLGYLADPASRAAYQAAGIAPAP